MVHGNGCGIVAFNKRTGEIEYQITDELAAYASPIVATIDGRRWCFALCRGGLVAFNPSDGRVDFQYPWRSRKLESVNASTPVVVGAEVFISETYGPGSCLLRVDSNAYDIVWRDPVRSRRRAMQAHWNTPIYHQGYLYGCSGRNPPDAELRCVEWSTGRVMWSRSDRERSSLLYVDQHAVCLKERGELSLIRLDPQRCDVVSSLTLRENQIDDEALGDSNRLLLRYPCWSAPILSHGLLYVRGPGRLVCLELIPASPDGRDSH
jgi:outer membrane protein assembly factor BamB